jgi:NDP-sugar pyrophosphorylase family protein
MNQQISLFVLAAGMGSRYGGLKQMEGFGPSGETIIEYSIYDAVRAGFGKFVFVIRPDMEEAFNDIFVKKYGDKIDISYIFQTVDMVPDHYKLNSERTKPWGTVHAVLVAKEAIQEPFLIINGDDFYGRHAFEMGAEFLRNKCSEDLYCLPAYCLENVLSENGEVKRGVCSVKDGKLESIVEAFEIKRDKNGSITGKTWDGEDLNLEDGTPISMNMFGVHQSIFGKLDRMFSEFLSDKESDLESEFILSNCFGEMIDNGEITMEVLETPGQWFGITYQEDAPVVREKLRNLVDKGVYPERLEV